MFFAPFDTETTGLTVHMDAPLKMQPRIIEFGGLITDSNEILHTLEFICNPMVSIDSDITRITGLTNEDLADKPPFEYFIPQLKDFFGKTDAGIAHNFSFDENLLRYDLQRLGLTLEDIDFPKIKICTVEQTMPFFGYNQKLDALYKRFCGEYVQKHRALDDVKLLHEICQTIGVYDAFSSAKG